MKLFNTNDIEMVKSCRYFFLFWSTERPVVKECWKICNQVLRWRRPVLLFCLSIQRLYVHTVLLT